MTYKGYQAIVELDEEAGVFHGEVINTRDAVTFQGSSVEELKQAFADSVDDYLEFRASRGKTGEAVLREISGTRAARSAPANYGGGPAAGQELECLYPGEAAAQRPSAKAPPMPSRPGP